MANLLPTEYWDFSFRDMIRGVIVAQARELAGRNPYIELPGVGRCLPVRSGRAAIVLALKALALPHGASVAVPLYCCPVVLTAIKAAGCRACFIDVDPATYCMSSADLAAKSAEIDAVIAVHMFGNVCDVPSLRCAAPGKPIIEDCAQALGSRLGDRAVGSFGEIAVFSFRSGKYISAGEGAVVFCSQNDLESRMAALIAKLPFPSRGEERTHVVKTFLRSKLRSKPLWGWVGTRLWSAYGKKVHVTSQAQIELTQIFRTDYSTTLLRLANLASAVAKQRSNAEYYLQNMAVDHKILCREKAKKFFNRLQFPLLLSSSAECEEFAACLQKEQISTARPYKDIASFAAEYHGYLGGCADAERIAQTVLVIPCNHSLKPKEVERILISMNRAWQMVNTRKGSASISSNAIHA
jgi:perosamine synthetase